VADRRCVIKGRDKFMAYFHEVKRTAMETDAEFLENYAPRSACVESVVQRLLDHDGSGDEFVRDMVHVPTWEQCFGDGNHRTTTLLTGAYLRTIGVDVLRDQTADVFASGLASWVADSKKWIVRRKSFDWPGDSAARNHRGTAVTWLKKALGASYTTRLTTAGPASLRNFFSCSEKRDR
jgi:hypothetical protein